MADPLVNRPDLRVTRMAPASQLLLHGEPEQVDQLSALAGFALGRDMLRSTTDGAWHALHLSPDEWLLIGPPAERSDEAARFSASTDLALSLVDVSDRTLGVEITGTSASLLLNCGCPLDLHPSVLPEGACTRTLFGKVAVMLWRPLGSDGLRMQYGRSFDDYVVTLLTTAALDVRSAVSES